MGPILEVSNNTNVGHFEGFSLVIVHDVWVGVIFHDPRQTSGLQRFVSSQNSGLTP